MTPVQILHLITAAGVLLWLLALRSVWRAGRAAAPAEATRLQLDVQPRAALAGDVGVAAPGATPADLTDLVRHELVRGHGPAVFQNLRIDEAGTEWIAFSFVPLRQGGVEAGPASRRVHGSLRFVRQGGGPLRAEWAFRDIPGRGMLFAAWLLIAAGAASLIAGHLSLLGFVARHPDPEVQWQVAQMAQVVHVLWPPFLLTALYRGQRTALRGGMETFLHNLPHLRSAAS